MAQMPRGKPRSVPDPAGELYDTMLRQERVKRERAEVATANSLPSLNAETFSRSRTLESLRRQPPRVDPTVTIGGQSYREVDNGRANVLVPADDPLVSPAEREERRLALERASFMADHPLAGAAYGIAALTNASPRARNAALIAGGFADSAMLAAAPLGARSSGAVRPPSRQPAWPTWRRPDIRYGELNGNGQATGVTATLTTPMLGFGTKANQRLIPPGWQGNGNDHNEARGHLLGNQLGGTGGDPRNIVTLTQLGANTPQMSSFERDTRRRVRAGEVVEYLARPLYNEVTLPPSAILLTAHGSRGAPSARLVHNPAGRRK